MTVVAALQPQDIQLIQTQHEGDKSGKEVSVTPVALIKSENGKDESAEASASVTIPYIQTSTAVQEYLQRMQSSTLPLSLHQFLKFNNTDVKREHITEDGVIETVDGHVETGETELIMNDIVEDMEENVDDPEKNKKKKKYKKKPPKPKKPKPGQVSPYFYKIKLCGTYILSLITCFADKYY